MVITGLHVFHFSKRLVELLLMVKTWSQEGRHTRPQGPLRPMPGTGIASFPPHSVGQSKAWSQRRFKAGGGVGGGAHLLMGRAAQSQCKSYADSEVENGAGYGSISLPCF